MSTPNIEFKYKPIFWPQDAIHISIDLETPSLAPNAAIAQLAAVGSHWRTGEILEFNEYVSIRSCERSSMDVCEETMQWWNKQDPALCRRVFGGTTEIHNALDNFYTWAFDLCNGRLDNVYLWGNGADFDCVILKEAFEIFRKYPFNFRNHEHLRTGLRMLPLDVQRQAHDDFVGRCKDRNFQPHDALADAWKQYVQMKYITAYAGGPDAYPPLF